MTDDYTSPNNNKQGEKMDLMTQYKRLHLIAKRRRQIILDLFYKKGCTLQEIADIYKITKQRIWEIVHTSIKGGDNHENLSK